MSSPVAAALGCSSLGLGRGEMRFWLKGEDLHVFCAIALFPP